MLLDIGASDRIEERLARPGGDLHAPHLLDLEVEQALRRFALRGQLSDERARQVLEDLAGLRLTRYPHHSLLERIWELRGNLSVFDACYVALAEALGAPLVTADAALARAPGHGAQIELYV